MNRPITIFLAAMCLLALAVPAAADLVITSDLVEDAGTAQESKSVHKTYIAADRARMEGRAKGGEFVLIYRQDQQLLWALDLAKKTVFEITREDMTRTRARMDEMRSTMDARMEQGMAKMTEEQKARMRKMMGSGSAKGPEKTEYKKVASGVKAGAWSTTHYKAVTGDESGKELFTVPFDKLGIKQSDLKVFEGFNDFIGALAPGTADTYPTGAADQEATIGYSGFPVKMVDQQRGRSTVTSVSSVDRTKIDGSLFEIPAGFTKQSAKEIEAQHKAPR